jgi:hypothetical protein
MSTYPGMLDISINGVVLTGYIQRATIEDDVGRPYRRVTLELELVVPHSFSTTDITTARQAPVTEELAPLPEHRRIGP